MQTTSGFARTAKLLDIHSTAASAFCRACAHASWQRVWEFVLTELTTYRLPSRMAKP